jgi:hypothetical protein
MRTGVGIAGYLLVMLLSAAPADASSCLQISACDAYLRKDIPLIFRGEVIEVEPVPMQLPSASQPEQSSPMLAVVNVPETDSVHFVIREWLKGKRQNADITVLAQRGTYQVGKEYLVYMDINPSTGVLFTNSCVRWQNMSEADSKVSDLQLLRDLSLTDGKGAIVGRFYLGGADMGGGQAPIGHTPVKVSIDGPVQRDTQSESINEGQAYLLAGIPAGEYAVSAKAPEGVSVIPVPEAMNRVSIAPNSCREVDWFLRVDSHIRGRVTDVAGRPVEHANVSLFVRGIREPDLARGRFAPISTRMTDADGRYDFAGINPGDYSVVLHPAPAKTGDAYPPVFYPALELPSEAQILHLKGPETIDGIDLVRPEELHPATVDLTVKRSNGTAITNAMVIITDPGFAIQTAAFGRTDSEGRLQVQLFSGREYTITASTPDPNGQPQETPQCAGPVEFVAQEGLALPPLIPDKTFKACRSATHPRLASQQ